MDITLCSALIASEVLNWHVSDGRARLGGMSDHKPIRFDFACSLEETEKKLNPRRTDWNLFSDLVTSASAGHVYSFNSTWELEEELTNSIGGLHNSHT